MCHGIKCQRCYFCSSLVPLMVSTRGSKNHLSEPKRSVISTSCCEGDQSVSSSPQETVIAGNGSASDREGASKRSLDSRPGRHLVAGKGVMTESEWIMRRRRRRRNNVISNTRAGEEQFAKPRHRGNKHPASPDQH
ncbi:hypothetical protein INR49_005547, partial [Caranx melampygus]